MEYLSKEFNNITEEEICLGLEWMEAKHALKDNCQTASNEKLRQLIDCFADDIDCKGSLSLKRHATETVGEWIKGLPENLSINGVMLMEKTNLEIIKKQYILDDSEEKIYELILSIDNMDGFLVDAAIEIKKQFGSDVEIYLNIEDAELSESPYLFASIITALPVVDALNKMDDIDQLWLLDNIDKVQGRFNFDVKWK